MKILILEDDARRVDIFNIFLSEKHTLEVVETAADAIARIQSDQFDLLFLDHDLGGEQFVDEKNTNTGSEVARYLASQSGAHFNLPIIIHSMNFQAAENMESILASTGYLQVYRINFQKLVGKYLIDPGFLC